MKSRTKAMMSRAGKTWPEVAWSVADEDFDIRLRGVLTTPDGELVFDAWEEGDGWCAALVLVFDLRDAEMCVRPSSACWSPTIAFSIARARDHLAAVHAQAMLDVLDDRMVELVNGDAVDRARKALSAVVAAGGIRAA